jgi:hypothetical protein
MGGALDAPKVFLRRGVKSLRLGKTGAFVLDAIQGVNAVLGLMQAGDLSGLLVVSVKGSKIRESVCKMFGIHPTAYCSIVNSYFTMDRRNRKVYTSAGDGSARKPGNQKAHATRIPRTETLRVATQKFVRELSAKQGRTTGKEVMEYMLANDHISVAEDANGIFDKRQYATAH